MLTAELAALDRADAQADGLGELGVLLSAALDTAATGFAIVDARAMDFPLVYVNAQFEALMGYAHDELNGRGFLTLFGVDNSDVVVEKMRAAFAKRDEFAGEFVAPRKDGTTFWNHLKVRLLRERQGTPKYFVVTQEDV